MSDGGLNPVLVKLVAAAIRDKAAEIDQRSGVHEADPDPMWFADEYARAALQALLEHCLDEGGNST